MPGASKLQHMPPEGDGFDSCVVVLMLILNFMLAGSELMTWWVVLYKDNCAVHDADADGGDPQLTDVNFTCSPTVGTL